MGSEMNLVMLTIYVLLLAGAQVLSVKYIVKLLGDLMERLILAQAVGGPPLQQGSPAMVPAVIGPVKGLNTEEPALPPLEAATIRMADYVEQQAREQGTPISRKEAVEQARIMMIDSGVMG